jgi:hypothetical protein
MSMPMKKIEEWSDVDDERFRREVLTQYRPVVLKGFVKHWPAVQRAMQSVESISSYLAGQDNGTPVDALMTRPEEGGRIFYTPDMNGFNFVRNQVSVSSVLEQLLRYARFPKPPSVAIQSALIAQCLPGFLAENRMSALGDAVPPRIWLGNTITTPAHFDESSNVACVVAGLRRFTLFPPEQIGNLYVGPLDYAPTGTPISMVSLSQPDFERFPRFREALAAAQVAELGPGDAIYIPPLWWHHVQSLGAFNMLVNYWWTGTPGSQPVIDSAQDCLLHSLLSLRSLPQEQRAAWRVFFDHYVFGDAGEAAAHIPAHRQGVLGPVSPEMARQVRAFLAGKLKA